MRTCSLPVWVREGEAICRDQTCFLKAAYSAQYIVRAKNEQNQRDPSPQMTQSAYAHQNRLANEPLVSLIPHQWRPQRRTLPGAQSTKLDATADHGQHVNLTRALTATVGTASCGHHLDWRVGRVVLT